MTAPSVPPSAGDALRVTAGLRVGDFNLETGFVVHSGLAVLFGPSGAGKSLTLAMIAGLVRPTTGIVEIRGRLVADGDRAIHVSTQNRRVGMVFQEGLLLPHRSVLDNVALGVRHTRVRRERREFARSWLHAVGAADLAARSPGTLSGGQRQRVALARGLAGNPDLVLLDEPLSALDTSVRKEMRALIRHVIVGTGVPALMVTHDQEEAEELGDAIIEFEHGRVCGVRDVGRREVVSW